MSMKNAIHFARMILSFALLGAIVAGVAGWGLDLDLRPYGAVLGGGAMLAYQLLTHQDRGR